MSRKIKIFTCPILLLFLMTEHVSGQSRKVISGSMDGLKNQSTYNIIFEFNNLTVGGLYVPEQEYLATKKSQWDQKDTVTADKFVKQWYDDRERLYAPAFIKKFEEYSRTKYDPNSDKTVIVKTTNIEGGWYGGLLE